MFCLNCGTVLDDGALFCKNCGCKVSDAAQQEPQQEEQGERTKREPKGKKGEKEKQSGKQGKNALRAFLSVLLSILTVLLGIGICIIFLVRHMVNEDTIDSAVKSLNISETKLSFVEGSPTIVELIRDNMDPEFRPYLTEESLEKLLGERFVRKFVSEKINNYVEDIFYHTGEGIIERKEIEKLLEQNREVIYKDTLLLIEDGESRQLVSQFEEYLGQTDLSVYREENPLIFQVIRCLSSYWMAALFGVLAVLFMACIIILQNKKSRGLIYLSIDLILVGVFNFAAAGMTSSLVTSLTRIVGLGKSFWKTLFEPAKDMGIRLGAIFVAAGLVLSLVCILIHIISQKIHRRNNKIHA